MSFILDALKKSEREREQQQQGLQPEIVYKRRNATQPLWMFAVTGLLVLNFVFVLVLWLRGDRQQTAPVITVNSGPLAGAPSGNAASPAAAAQVNTASSSATPSTAPGDVRSLQEEVYPPAIEPDVASNALSRADVAEGPQLVRSINQDAAANNASTNPALNPGLAAAINNQNSARNNGDSVPSLDSLGGNAALNLPQLHLDVHVYSSTPAERFVFINMRKYTEGQSLNEGPLLEHITPDGAILSHAGRRFLLPRQ